MFSQAEMQLMCCCEDDGGKSGDAKHNDAADADAKFAELANATLSYLVS